jgi:leucyl/phenylalanyl-tRNA--protein transferase
MVSLPIPGQSRWRFPDPATAGEDGLVGIGADLEPATLLDAYRQGIFPWPHPGAPLPWFSPDPRGVIPLDGVTVSRSLRVRLRRSGWETTIDRAFAAVLAGCADRPRDQLEGGTWITPPMRAAYQRLHDLGHAHSLEVWDAD